MIEMTGPGQQIVVTGENLLEREREGERCSVLTLEYKNKKFLIQHFLSELFSSDRRSQDHIVLGTFNMRTRIDEVHIK